MRLKKIFIVISMLFCLEPFAQAEELKKETFSTAKAHRKSAAAAKLPSKLSLEQCLDIALDRSRHRTVSSFAVKIAEYQHKQALSSYWPSLVLNSAFARLDEEFNFIFPEETALYSISGFPQPLGVTVPEKEIKLMNRNIGITRLDLSLPVYTGGIRSAIIEQSKSGVEAAKQAARRTDLQIVYDVKRIYYGAVLAKNIYEIGRDALARLNATLTLTEKLYKEGSGSVSKTDYLKSKILVESFHSMVASLSSNQEISKAALLNTMGLPWDSDLELSETKIPFNPYTTALKQLVSNSYKFNPDWKQLLVGLEAAKAKIKEEKGGRLPKLMLSGTLWNVNSSYDAGITSDENKDGWKVGAGMQIPLFSGFLTTSKINEAKARLNKMQEQKILLKEGIAIQIKHAFILMDGFNKQVAATGKAVRSANENLDLNIRAYDSDLVETQDVIQSQLIDSFMQALHLKALYKHAETQFHLDLLIGKEIRKILEAS